MASELSAKYQDLLNPVVDGNLDNYNVKIVEGKLKGENFLGDIVFATLENKTSQEYIHLIIKNALEGLKDKEGYFSNVFTKEIYFYEHIWPTLHKYQESHSLGFNKTPKCYAVSKIHGEEKLVMENLLKQNYKLFDKTKALDINHLELIFKCYGTFHAISAAFKEVNPEKYAEIVTTLEKYKSGLSEQDQAYLQNTFDNLDFVISLFDPKIDEALLKTIEKFKPNANQVYEDIEIYKETSILLHGDCWSNNMLFQYDENGAVKDMKFLDFQLISIGTPVGDLSYCLYSGASKESLDKLDDLLRLYLSSFNETLKKLNCQLEQPYTYEKLKAEWKRFCTYGYLAGLVLWRVKLADKNHIPKITDNSLALLNPVAEEHKETFHQLIKDLTVHLYENDFFN